MSNATNTKPAFTHDSYKAACAALKSGKAAHACWDAGEGFYSTGYYCARRKRVICTLHDSQGRMVA